MAHAGTFVIVDLVVAARHIAIAIFVVFLLTLLADVMGVGHGEIR
jgi:hypothetical protein